MSGAAVRQDVEAGENAFAVARPGGPSPISHTMQGRAQASQRFIVGVVILLFVAGLVPFSSVLFLLLALFALASCVQYNLLARHEADQGRPGIAGRMPAWQSAERMHRAAILGMMGTFGFANPALHHLMAAHPTRTTMHNLRLSLMNRDFTDADYEMLLQLDQPDGSTAPPSAAVEEEIASLPTYKFKADKVAASVHLGTQDADDDQQEDNSMTCSICLDPYADQDRLTLLPCTHKFHAFCIQPWLRQGGHRAQCPMCKSAVFDR